LHNPLQILFLSSQILTSSAEDGDGLSPVANEIGASSAEKKEEHRRIFPLTYFCIYHWLSFSLSLSLSLHLSVSLLLAVSLMVLALHSHPLPSIRHHPPPPRYSTALQPHSLHQTVPTPLHPTPLHSSRPHSTPLHPTPLHYTQPHSTPAPIANPVSLIPNPYLECRGRGWLVACCERDSCFVG
jgi:hypothetical protein